MALSSLIGLSREKSRARVAIRASMVSGEVFDHTLLYGIGGTGKTAFARAIGHELNYNFVETHAAAFKHRHQLFEALVRNSAEAAAHHRPLLFFLDEVHRLKLPLQEVFYSAMNEWWIPTEEGKRYIPPFTLIAATTRFDMLDANSFVTRFPNKWELERYPQEDIEAIVAWEFDKYGLGYSSEVVTDIARRCLGVPRIAVTLAGKVRMVVLSIGARTAELKHTQKTFEMEQIDNMDLDPVHRKYLQKLAVSRSDDKFVPLGITVISAKLGRHEDLIRGSVEPILFELDFVAPTLRGRILTTKGAEYLKKVAELS